MPTGRRGSQVTRSWTPILGGLLGLAVMICVALLLFQPNFGQKKIEIKTPASLFVFSRMPISPGDQLIISNLAPGSDYQVALSMVSGPENGIDAVRDVLDNEDIGIEETTTGFIIVSHRFGPLAEIQNNNGQSILMVFKPTNTPETWDFLVVKGADVR